MMTMMNKTVYIVALIRKVLMIWDINLGILKPLIDNPEKKDGEDKSEEEKDYGF